MNFFKKNRPTLDDTSMHQGVNLITSADPTSFISEQYKTLRTNILYSNADEQIKTLVFTSSGPSEGKSTVSGNVAVTFANQGLRTLLMDADMRRPTVHATFSAFNDSGLVTLLTGEESNEKLAQTIIETEIDHLYALPAGPVPPNPSELLSSKRMHRLMDALKNSFDIIILDAPPVGSVTDAQILASQADATILVVPYGIAQKELVAEAQDLLQKANANLIGAVMNRIPPEEHKGYYGYYNYSYTGTSNSGKSRKHHSSKSK